MQCKIKVYSTRFLQQSVIIQSLFSNFFYCLVLFFGNFVHPRFYLLKLIPPLNRSLSHIHVFLSCFMTHWFELGLTVSAKDWRYFFEPAELCLGYTTKTITVFPPTPSGGNISAGGIIGTYSPLPKLWMSGYWQAETCAGVAQVTQLFWDYVYKILSSTVENIL